MARHGRGALARHSHRVRDWGWSGVSTRTPSAKRRRSSGRAPILAATVFDTYFAGQLASLSAIAASPSVTSGDVESMTRYFASFRPGKGGPFNAGVGWIDLEGRQRATSDPRGPTSLSFGDRTYFTSVISTKKPFVSEVIVGRSTDRRIVVMSVPTERRPRSPHGRARRRARPAAVQAGLEKHRSGLRGAGGARSRGPADHPARPGATGEHGAGFAAESAQGRRARRHARPRRFRGPCGRLCVVGSTVLGGGHRPACVDGLRRCATCPRDRGGSPHCCIRGDPGLDLVGRSSCAA